MPGPYYQGFQFNLPVFEVGIRTFNPCDSYVQVKIESHR